jgi:Mg-chelatase subunit ChlD
MDRLLGHLYGREYRGRGVREEGAPGGGGADPSRPSVPEWLLGVRELFPRDTVEIIERHALQRYGMIELLADPEILERIEPSYELLKTMLVLRGRMRGPLLEAARRLVRRTVEEIRQRLARDTRPLLWGRLNRHRPSRLKIAGNLDWRRTLRDNLKNYDPERRRIVLEKLHFSSRVQRHLPWHIVLAVDCSASMIGSVIHSAVMAGIFKSLPALRVNLVVFDTSVVDLSDRAEDPTEVLLSVNLGGGTDIGQALSYCETLVTTPHRTVVVLVTDFIEGGPPGVMLAAIRRLREAGARVLGLAALDEKADPYYDRDMAARCVDAGAEVAALTPAGLTEWLAQVLS